VRRAEKIHWVSEVERVARKKTTSDGSGVLHCGLKIQISIDPKYTIKKKLKFLIIK
jgi:hypothetical protein